MPRLRDVADILNAVASGPGRGGRPVIDWAHADEAPDSRLGQPCSVFPEQALEDTGNRQTTTDRYVSYWDHQQPIRATSRVRWRGRIFEVVGNPVVWMGRDLQMFLEVKLEEISDQGQEAPQGGASGEVA